VSVGPVAGARTMYDSVTARHLPRHAQMVAGYIDGAYAWSAADWALFPNSALVSITVLGGSQVADVVDFETGNVSAAEAAAWAANMIALGRYPTVYVQESRINELQAAMGARGIHSFGLWRANWNGSADLYVNDTAHQYGNPLITGGHYDISVVRPYWPGVDAAPAPPPAPAPPAPAPPPPPPPSPGPPPPAPLPGPPPPPPAGPPIDQARGAWAQLAEFLTLALPAYLAQLLRALGIIRSRS
jgi:hypothetical protein